jgi:probable rRNA maturation factor
MTDINEADTGTETDLHLVQAFDEQSDIGIDLDRYVRLARFVLETERPGLEAELTIVFVDETTMADYHERFLDEPGPTDVMAFPMDEELPPSGRSPDNGDRGPGAPAAGGEPPAILGDVMVCPAFAAREAAARGVDVTDEIALLVVHGVLHLLNYDHAEPSEEAVMQERQRALLGGFASDELRRTHPDIGREDGR